MKLDMEEFRQMSMASKAEVIEQRNEENHKDG
jgi:hypothetical protein